MNEDNIKQIKQFGLIMLVYFIIVIGIVIYTNIHYKNTSTPVEEMYHRQLVTTLDSILDARFGPSCCEEAIDSNNISVTHTRFNGILSPME